jgi:transposase
MPSIHLSASEQNELDALSRQNGDAKVLRRARAILALNNGERPGEVATKIGVSRSTIYEWVHRYTKQNNQSLRLRLQDRPRPGRPQVKRQEVIAVLPRVLASSPRQHGYGIKGWTIRLLKLHLADKHRLVVSRETVRRAVIDLKHQY